MLVMLGVLKARIEAEAIVLAAIGAARDAVRHNSVWRHGGAPLRPACLRRRRGRR
jgi:hypothetical protein